MRPPMPTLQQRPNHALGFAIGLGAADSGEPLINLGIQAGLYKRVQSGRPGPFFAVICVPAFDGIGAFLLDVFQEGCGRPLGFIGQDGSEELTRIVIDADKEIYGGLSCRLPLQQRQSAGIRMDHLAGVVFVVALRLLLQLRLDSRFNFGQPLDAIPQTPKALVGTGGDREVLAATAVEHFIDCGATHPIIAGQISHPIIVGEIGVVDGFALFGRQPGFLMNVHGTSVVDSLQ